LSLLDQGRLRLQTAGDALSQPAKATASQFRAVTPVVSERDKVTKKAQPICISVATLMGA
jgi:hypothetical protein